MRNKLLKSLIFTALTSCAGVAYSMPTTVSGDVGVIQTHNVTEPRAGGKVDLNSADALTLQRELAGVGEAKAKAIVGYRESNGPFTSLDELLEVKGIGKAILDKNREIIKIN